MRVMHPFADETGATLMIVALSLIALMGITVIVVDVGGLLTLRRQMITAADSAALAAAQSCAMDQPADAPVVANQFASDNVAGTTRTAFDLVGCGSSGFGSVDLAYEKDQQLFFAPILGSPDTTEVKGRATAIWGPSATAPVLPTPMTLDTGSGEPPCYADRTGDPCGYWFSDDRDAAAFTNRSTGGFAHLATWPSTAGRRCRGASGSQVAGWMATMPTRTISTSSPTYVCHDRGESDEVFDGFSAHVGDVVIFPINDSAGMIYQRNRANKFSIVGFAPLQIAAVYRGDDSAAIGTPAVDDTCQTRIDDEDIEPNDVINLLGIDEPGCPRGAIPDRVDTPVITNRQGQPYVAGTDYTYDAASLSITWLKDFSAPGNSGNQGNNGNGNGNGNNGNGNGNGNNGNNGNQVVDIEYDWHIDGTTGACGQQAADDDAVCIVTRWQGAQMAGGSPAEGIADFGVRAVRLDQ